MSDKFWLCCCSEYQVQGPVVLDGEASRAEALEKLTKHEAGERDNLNKLIRTLLDRINLAYVNNKKSGCLYSNSSPTYSETDDWKILNKTKWNKVEIEPGNIPT